MFISGHFESCPGELNVHYEYCRPEKSTVELQWLEHRWNHENMFETGVF